MAEFVGCKELGSLTDDPKSIKDFTKETDTFLEGADAQEADSEAFVEKLLALEKSLRLASDGKNSTRLVQRLLDHYHKREDWDGIITQLPLLTRKRSQLRRVISEASNKCIDWLDSTPAFKEEALRVRFVDMLCQITEGKIFVETEYVKLLRIKSRMQEEKGDIMGAAKTIQDVQVETIGAMDKIERAKYVLEQMRLVLRTEDLIRFHILSKKINRKLLNSDDMKDLKLEYYAKMIQVHLMEENHALAFDCYKEVYKTDNESETLANMILTTILASGDRSESLKEIKKNEAKKLVHIPVYASLLTAFLTEELVWPLVHEKEIMESKLFRSEGGPRRLEILRKRVMQHGIRVITKIFRRASIPRLAELLFVDNLTCEEGIAELVCDKEISAQIDRPLQEVYFATPSNEGKSELAQWTKTIKETLDHVNTACQLAEKEKMIYEARLKA